MVLRFLRSRCDSVGVKHGPGPVPSIGPRPCLHCFNALFFFRFISIVFFRRAHVKGMMCALFNGSEEFDAESISEYIYGTFLALGKCSPAQLDLLAFSLSDTDDATCQILEEAVARTAAPIEDTDLALRLSAASDLEDEHSTPPGAAPCAGLARCQILGGFRARNQTLTYGLAGWVGLAGTAIVPARPDGF